MITIAASSDFHGHLPEVTEPFDLMLLGGDLEPAHDHYYLYQKEWYCEYFVPWINDLPFKDDQSKVIFIAGNHSCYLAQEGANSPSIYQNIIKPCNGRLIYLHNQEYVHNHINLDTGEITNLKIFGTPYCKIFGKWWNMLDDDNLRIKYEEIPNDLDILLSHDSPSLFGLGEIKHRNPIIDAGNKILSNFIEMKKPHYFFSGHIHSGEHSVKDNEFTKMANVSLLDENYRVAYPILYLNI